MEIENSITGEDAYIFTLEEKGIISSALFDYNKKLEKEIESLEMNKNIERAIPRIQYLESIIFNNKKIIENLM